MRIEVSQVRIQDLSLHRLTLNPETTARGGLVFFHGQGDFIDRYPTILESFVNAGYRCILTDMPGHGRSPGKPGVVPGLNFTEELFRNSVSLLTGKLVISGHSMGGLMALRFLLQNHNLFDAAWISSPLLEPMRQAKPWMKIALPLAANLFPSITVSTGVSSSDCGDSSVKVGAEENQNFFHNRISIGWVRALRDAAEEVHKNFTTMALENPILFTQGDLDPICPPRILETWLNELSPNQISSKIIKGALHEPFSGSTHENFLTHLNDWIDQKLG